jgi:hypothetical protein
MEFDSRQEQVFFARHCVLKPTKHPIQWVSGYARETSSYRERTQEYNSAMTSASRDSEIKGPSANVPYPFWIHGQIYHLVTPPYRNEKNMTGYEELYIWNFSEARTTQSRSELRGIMKNSVLLRLGPSTPWQIAFFSDN